jgi:hypothetical protein
MNTTELDRWADDGGPPLDLSAAPPSLGNHDPDDDGCNCDACRDLAEDRYWDRRIARAEDAREYGNGGEYL